MQQRHQERAVGTGLDGNPLVGNGRVAGTNRVDRDKAPAAALELGQRNLHRVAVVVLRRAEHHKHLGAVQVGAAKFPKTAAHGVNHAGRHIDRAKAAMRRVIGRAELAGEQAGQSLHLVAPSEECKFLGVGGADFLQALGQELVGFFPRDGLELGRSPLAAGLAQQGLRQPRGRDLFHDARGALGANHALVERVVWVAVDVAHLGAVVALAQMHADAAAAGAHIASGALDGGLGRGCGRLQRLVHRLGR